MTTETITITAVKRASGWQARVSDVGIGLPPTRYVGHATRQAAVDAAREGLARAAAVHVDSGRWTICERVAR